MANDIYPTPEEMIQRANEGDQIARSSVRARQIETGGAVLVPDSTPTKPRESRKMSGALLRLARRIGVDADELAKRIPADTLRRTKYPVVEEVQPDGKILYKHNPMK